MSETVEAPPAPPAPVVDIEELAAEAVMRAFSQMERPPPRNCGNCRYWTPLHNFKTHGQCLLSAKAAPIPVVTTDLQRCSGWSEA